MRKRACGHDRCDGCPCCLISADMVWDGLCECQGDFDKCHTVRVSRFFTTCKNPYLQGGRVSRIFIQCIFFLYTYADFWIC